jgi:formate dehydrogenase (coenzyme F420) beta subunit
MSHFSMIDTYDKPNRAVSEILARLLREDVVDAVLAPGVNEWSELPLPTLFADPEALIARGMPLAPVAAVSMATQAARSSRGKTGHRLAVVLKPCELRAVVELAKLRQADCAGMTLISLECPGRLENSAYLEERAKDGEFADSFLSLSGQQARLTATCASCEAFTPENADITLHTLGLPPGKRLAVSWNGSTGETMAEAMGLQPTEGEIADRKAALDALTKQRAVNRETLFSKTAQAMDSLEGLQKILGSCLGCLNCRTACPVCYCRECICGRESFDRDPVDLQARAAKQGSVRLPDNITMFHLTRMAHMAHACVGCGQCSSVCPSNIHVADLFRLAAAGVQEEFHYVPGRDLDAPIPYLDFSGEGDK